jgi:hypothetical protein
MSLSVDIPILGSTVPELGIFTRAKSLRPATRGCIPVTWVTPYSGDMGNSFSGAKARQSRTEAADDLNLRRHELVRTRHAPGRVGG